MSYTTPITDRTHADVLARNSKAFLNVADWNRIYNNARLANALAVIELATPIAFDPVSEPTIATIPTASWPNTMLANIERLRLEMVALIPTLTEIKDDWEGGAHKPVFDYQYVNQWERTIDAIWEYFDGSDLDVCPTLAANLTLSADYIVVDCIDTNGHTLDTNGHTLYII